MQKIEILKNKSGESIYPLTSTKAVVDENGNTIEDRLVVADGEDLVTDGNVLRLKDRPNTDGMGYVILRKDKTFQEQVTRPNTIYEIRYDFDLGRQELPVVLDTPFVLPSTGGAYYRTGDHIDVEAGMTVDLPSGGVLFDGTLSAIIPAPYTPSSKKSLYVGKLQSEAALGQSCVYSLEKDVVIPENCVLKFEGGSLSNGAIVGDNTKLDGAVRFLNVQIKGYYANSSYYTEWFKYKEETDQPLFDTIEFLSKNKNNKSIYFENRTYKLNVKEKSENDSLSYCGAVVRSNTNLYLSGEIRVNVNNLPNYCIFMVLEAENINIKGQCRLYGDRDGHIYTEGSSDEWGHAIDVRSGKNVNISDLEIFDFTGDGICCDTRSSTSSQATENLHIYNVKIYNTRRNGISVVGCNNVYIKNCILANVGMGNYTAPRCGIDIEPERIDIEVGHNILVEDCIATNCGYGFKCDHSKENGNNVRFINCFSDSKCAFTNANNCLFSNCTFLKFVESRRGSVVFKNCNLGVFTVYESTSQYKKDFTSIKLDNCNIALDYTSNDVLTAYNNSFFYIDSIPNVEIDIRNSNISIGECRLLQNKAIDKSFKFSIKNTIIDSDALLLPYVDLYSCTVYYNIIRFPYQTVGTISNIINNTFIKKDITDESEDIVFFGVGAVPEGLCFVFSGNTFNKGGKPIKIIGSSWIPSGDIIWTNNLLHFNSSNEYNTFVNSLKSIFNIITFSQNITSRYPLYDTFNNMPKQSDGNIGGMVYASDFEFPVFWNGYKYLDAGGFAPRKKVGTLENIPETASEGASYYISDYNKTAWFDYDKSRWRDANGFPINKSSGTTEERPSGLTQADRGYMYYDTSLLKPVWWRGTAWVEGDSQEAGIQRAGTWSQRPNADGSFLDNGFQYFLLESTPDTDPEGQPIESLTGNGKPIWWIQSSRKWVDAFGNTVTGGSDVVNKLLSEVNEVRHIINGEEYKFLTTEDEWHSATIYAPTELENDGYVVAQQDNKAKFVNPADIGLK